MPDKERSVTLETKAMTVKVGADFDPSLWLWAKVLKANKHEVRIQFATEIDKKAIQAVESPAT